MQEIEEIGSRYLREQRADRSPLQTIFGNEQNIAARSLSPADKRSFRANMLGVNMEGVYKPRRS